MATSCSAADGEQVNVAKPENTGADDSRGKRSTMVTGIGPVRSVDAGAANGDMPQGNVCCKNFACDWIYCE